MKSKISKVTSANNSIASHKGMSRSKSKTNLEICSKNFKTKPSSVNTSQQKIEGHLQSNQVSLQKVDRKNKILSEKKNTPNLPLSRKGSRAELLKSTQEPNKKTNHKTITIPTKKKAAGIHNF